MGVLFTLAYCYEGNRAGNKAACWYLEAVRVDFFFFLFSLSLESGRKKSTANTALHGAVFYFMKQLSYVVTWSKTFQKEDLDHTEILSRPKMKERERGVFFFSSFFSAALFLNFGCLERGKVVTWLILPVVICLSQRLSHACLSINGIQWNCGWLIKSVIVYLIVPPTWITVGNPELIHAQKSRLEVVGGQQCPLFLSWKGCIY